MLPTSSCSTWTVRLVITSILTVLLTYILRLGDTPSNPPQEASRRDDTWNQLVVTGQNLISSSVWCRSLVDGFCANSSCLTCRFRNLCYRPDLNEFVFFHGDHTIVSGLPSSGEVDMSSVVGLNTLSMSLTDLPSTASAKLDIRMPTAPTRASTSPVFVLMKRFKPDNVMHVIHDDLLPAFATILSEVCSTSGQIADDDLWLENCFSGVHLTLLDGHAEHEYFPLYELLSVVRPLLIEDFMVDGRTYCFPSAIVGLSKETVWYDYGFNHPQCPSGRQLPSSVLRLFVTHVLKKLGHDDHACTTNNLDYAVLILRQINRQILNSGQLMEAIATTTGLRIVVLDPKESFSKSVKLVACAKLLIGMHGATLVLALFLKPGSALIELFPYLVPSNGYTSYRTLASIPGLHLKYVSWENRFIENTRTHPDWPTEYGGLGHLPQAQRQQIVSRQVPIEPHKCCSHPEWLFRIYQDTVVDIPSFVHVLERLIGRFVQADKLPAIPSLRPGPMRNLECSRTNKDGDEFRVTWRLPWNLQYLLTSDRLRPECDHAMLWLQRDGSSEITSILVNDKSTYSFRFFGKMYNCWVSCIVANVTGIVRWTTCN